MSPPTAMPSDTWKSKRNTDNTTEMRMLRLVLKHLSRLSAYWMTTAVKRSE